uniref:Uncharacterized protein n=1 Tax=Oryza nivara TaxID=4536 RepID=A0A0E0H2L2_ORYNI
MTVKTLSHDLGRPHVKTVNDLPNIRNSFKCSREDCLGLGILKDNEAASTLIESSCKLLVKDHLRQLLLNMINWQLNHLRDMCNLYPCVRLNQPAQVLLQEGIIQR